MKGAAFRGGAVLTVLCGLFVPVLAQEAAPTAATPELVVTDADRVVRNFTQEAAVVGKNQLRLELSGFTLHKDSDVRLDLIGYSIKPFEENIGSEVHSLSGGVINLLGSYGIGGTAEVGVNIPIMFEDLSLRDPETGFNAGSMNAADMGDLLMYAKFRREVMDHLSVGAGMDLLLPTGIEKDGFGTGEVGTNPFVSARYQQGRVGTGINVGYLFNTGDVPNVFNWGWELIVRANKTFALRCEITGRLFDQAGDKFDDVTVLPGVDIAMGDRLVIRPSGLTHITDEAIGWGVGIGIAYTLDLGVAEAAPPPPPPPPRVAPAPPPVKQKIVLRGVNFDFDKSTIRPDAMPVLDEAIRTLKEAGDVSVICQGYTDSIGSDQYNKALSLRRANAVRDYLVAGGIAPTRISVEGFGKSNPVASNDTADGRAQNRRVELRVTGG